MSHTLTRLQVQEYTKWRPIFDELASVRQSYGCQGGQLFRQSDKPNEVVILFEWNNAESARQYFESPELRQAMQRGGVQGRPEISYLGNQEPLAL
jgi:quinol monooxygenase YgiN